MVTRLSNYSKYLRNCLKTITLSTLYSITIVKAMREKATCRIGCLQNYVTFKFNVHGRLLLTWISFSPSSRGNDVIMISMAFQITSLAIFYSTAYSGTHQRKHQSSASLVCMRRIHRLPVNSPHKEPATPTMFPFDDVVINYIQQITCLFSTKNDEAINSLWPRGLVKMDHF